MNASFQPVILFIIAGVVLLLLGVYYFVNTSASSSPILSLSPALTTDLSSVVAPAPALAPALAPAPPPYRGSSGPPSLTQQSTLFAPFSTAPTNAPGPDGFTPWIWNQGGKPGAWSAWTSASPGDASPAPWPTYSSEGPGGTQPLLIADASGYWFLSFLTATNQLCMWQYGPNDNGSAYIFKPIWWTMAYFGPNPSLPTFDKDGTISCGNHSWGWKPTSGQGPFTLSLSGSGEIVVTGRNGAPVSMAPIGDCKVKGTCGPSWPTSGYYGSIDGGRTSSIF